MPDFSINLASDFGISSSVGKSKITLTFLFFVGPTKTGLDFVPSNNNFFGARPASQTNAQTDRTPFIHISASDPSELKNFI